MLLEVKRIALTITMALAALIIEALVLFGYMMSHSQKTAYISNFIYDVGLTRWGWLPVLFLAGSSIILTTKWNLGSVVLRGISIFISVIIIIAATMWLLGLYFISHLNP